MIKSRLVRLTFLLLTVSSLSGCIWWVDDDGRRGHDHERGRGDYHEEHHGDHHEEHR